MRKFYLIGLIIAISIIPSFSIAQNIREDGIFIYKPSTNWTPAKLSSLGPITAWYSKITGIAEDAAVTSWSDIGGLGNTITTTNAANQPVFSTDFNSYGSVFWNQTVDGTNILERASDTDFDNFFSTGGSIAIFLKINTDGGGSSGRLIEHCTDGVTKGWTFSTTNEAGGAVKINLYIVFSGSLAQFKETSADFTTEKNWLFVVTYSAANTTNVPTFYRNATAKAVTTLVAPVGAISADSGCRTLFGNAAAVNRSLDGYMYEIVMQKGVIWGSYEIGQLYLYGVKLGLGI